MPLTKSQRNRVFQAIEAVGLDPATFEWGAAGRMLRHEGTSSAFWFVKSLPDRFVDRLRRRVSRALGDAALAESPTGYTLVDGRASTSFAADNWEELEQAFQRWLYELRAELDEPDLWAQLGDGGGDGGYAGANSRFTEEEVGEIRAQLDKILEEVQEQSQLSAGEIKDLQDRFEYLKDAAARLGRLDWRNLVAGVMLTAITEAILPPETTRDILVTIVRTLGHLYFHRMFPGLPAGP
jgi:hypothetical protein